jgi:predicted choloylglycine hydrolase
MNVFFGSDPKVTGQMVGVPIPGYSGANRRIGADNLFGMTYAEARNAACQSQSNIDNEKGNTLIQTSKFVPSYETMGAKKWDM